MRKTIVSLRASEEVIPRLEMKRRGSGIIKPIRMAMRTRRRGSFNSSPVDYVKKALGGDLGAARMRVVECTRSTDGVREEMRP